MIVLNASGISKSYLTRPILEDISFNIENRDKVGLIGINGSGKTTLMNILAGKLKEDSGSVYMPKGMKIGYLVQNPEFDENSTVYQTCKKEFQDLFDLEEAIRNKEKEIAQIKDEDKLNEALDSYQKMVDSFEKRNGYSIKSEINGMLKGLGFTEDDFDKDTAKLSGGQKSRLHLASLLLNKPDLLFLDEPTNHLDIGAINFLENLLVNFQGAVVLISHDRYFLDKVVNRIFHIENRKLKTYNLNYSKFVEARKKELEIARKTYANQQKEIKRQEEIIERFSNYGRDRYIRQAESRRKMLDKIDLVERPQEDVTSMKIDFSPSIVSGEDVLQMEKIKKVYDSRTILEDISFQVYRGDRIGIIGDNGVGKSTLIKMVTGEVMPDDGRVIIGSNVVKGYYDQQMDSLNKSNDMITEILDEYPSMKLGEIRSYLAAFNFFGEEVFKTIDSLSGGEKGRLQLLKIMLRKPNFLLMDEPTNHLDIDSKEILEDALNSYEASYLIISHDRYFLNKVANKIIHIEKDKARVYYGNYDYYIQKINEEKENQKEKEESKTKTSIIKEKKKQKEGQKELRQKKKMLKDLEKDMTKLEERQKEIEESLCQKDTYEDFELANKLNMELEEIKKKHDETFEKYFEISEELEEND